MPQCFEIYTRIPHQGKETVWGRRAGARRALGMNLYHPLPRPGEIATSPPNGVNAENVWMWPSPDQAGPNDTGHDSTDITGEGEAQLLLTHVRGWGGGSRPQLLSMHPQNPKPHALGQASLCPNCTHDHQVAQSHWGILLWGTCGFSLAPSGR